MNLNGTGRVHPQSNASLTETKRKDGSVLQNKAITSVSNVMQK
jgi:hypothetical protein